MIFRKAEKTDIDFIIETIVVAEKSGSDIIGYCSTFDISQVEFEKFLRFALEEEIEGQEFCLDHFLIAEIDGKTAGACSAWIEDESGVTSNMLKAYLFLDYFGNEKMKSADTNLKRFAPLHFEREKYSIQIESVYVKHEYRGQGITGLLIRKQLEDLLKGNDKIVKAQVSTTCNNLPAIKAYEKLNFKITGIKKIDDHEILKQLPFNERCLLELNLK